MTTWKTLGKSYGVLPADGGTVLDVFGNDFRLKLSGEESHGGVAVIVATFAPGTGAPPHIHRGHDECYYVVNGRFRFRVGDEFIEGGPGSICYAPRDHAHGFDNISDDDATLLGILAPAGYEQHFIEMNDPPPGKDLKEWFGELYEKYDQVPAPPPATA